MSLVSTLFLLLILPGAQETARPPGKAILVGPDDAITISSTHSEEISKTWRVNASGELKLPMIGTVKAAGLTVEELEREIGKRLSKYVRDPQVSLYVSEYRSQPVTVSGGVEKPGTYQIGGPTRLFEVLLMAGGPKAGTHTLTIMRRRDNGPLSHSKSRISSDEIYHLLELPVGEVMRGHGDDSDFLIHAHDAISVAAERRRFVHVAGEVNRPGAVELATTDTVSLTKVMALAGGLSRTAAPKKTLIRHINAQGIETAIASVDLQKILSGKTKDLELSDGDIVIVPTNQVMQYLQTMTHSALTSGFWILARL